ncbi:MAG TPA: SDR family oxidoreductase [Saprospiraceae bacterium]|nr:SDR family oxidoreductase [Saprospiraceae bacterium]HMQ84303.1 SDR family oxidoreductase [Saprospiraceae bacterium]
MLSLNYTLCFYNFSTASPVPSFMTNIQQIAILGCGWLGFPLGKKLVQEGYSVKGSTTREAKLPLIEAVGIQPFLIRVETSLMGNDLPDFFEADILVLNLPPGGRKNPEAVRQHPAQIAAILAEAAKSQRLKKVLFISSTGVYGSAIGKVTETTPLQPDTTSGRALVEAENLLSTQKKWDLTILRMAGLVGGERHPGRFLAGKKDVLGAQAPINLVHLDDCIAVIQQIFHQEIWGEVFNVCADEHPNKKTFYTLQTNKLGLEAPVFSHDQEGKDEKWVSNEKLKAMLHYTFLHPDPMQF